MQVCLSKSTSIAFSKTAVIIIIITNEWLFNYFGQYFNLNSVPVDECERSSYRLTENGKNVPTAFFYTSTKIRCELLIRIRSDSFCVTAFVVLQFVPDFLNRRIYFWPFINLFFNSFWKFLNRTTAIFIIFVIESKLDCNNFTTIIIVDLWAKKCSEYCTQYPNRHHTDSRLKRQMR